MHDCTYSYPSPSISFPTPCMAVHNSSRAFLKVLNSPIHAHILYPTSPMNPPSPFSHSLCAWNPLPVSPLPSTMPINLSLMHFHCSHTHLHFFLNVTKPIPSHYSVHIPPHACRHLSLSTPLYSPTLFQVPLESIIPTYAWPFLFLHLCMAAHGHAWPHYILHAMHEILCTRPPQSPLMLA